MNIPIFDRNHYSNDGRNYLGMVFQWIAKLQVFEKFFNQKLMELWNLSNPTHMISKVFKKLMCKYVAKGFFTWFMGCASLR